MRNKKIHQEQLVSTDRSKLSTTEPNKEPRIVTCRNGSGQVRCWMVVVDAADQSGHRGDAEEVIGVCEEAHACDDDGCEVVPLSLGFVQTGEDLQLRHFALTIVNMLTQVVKKPQVSDDHS